MAARLEAIQKYHVLLPEKLAAWHTNQTLVARPQWLEDYAGERIESHGHRSQFGATSSIRLL